MLQQLQSLLQLWQTSRSHCAHASFTSAVLTHDEQARDAPTGGTAWQRQGKERMSFRARQREQLKSQELQCAAQQRTATGGSTAWTSGMPNHSERSSELWWFFRCSAASSALRDATTEHKRGTSEIRQLKYNTSFKERKVKKYTAQNVSL